MNEKNPKDKGAAPSPDPQTKPKRPKPKKKKTPDPEEVGDLVREVLLDLLRSSESDSVRVAAAKVLLERVKPNGGPEKGESADAGEGERDEVLIEARAILAAFTEAKFGGPSGAFPMDQDGTA